MQWDRGAFLNTFTDLERVCFFLGFYSQAQLTQVPIAIERVIVTQ